MTKSPRRSLMSDQWMAEMPPASDVNWLWHGILAPGCISPVEHQTIRIPDEQVLKRGRTGRRIDYEYGAVGVEWTKQRPIRFQVGGKIFERNPVGCPLCLREAGS